MGQIFSHLINPNGKYMHFSRMAQMNILWKNRFPLRASYYQDTLLGTCRRTIHMYYFMELCPRPYRHYTYIHIDITWSPPLNCASQKYLLQLPSLYVSYSFLSSSIDAFPSPSEISEEFSACAQKKYFYSLLWQVLFRSRPGEFFLSKTL